MTRREAGRKSTASGVDRARTTIYRHYGRGGNPDVVRHRRDSRFSAEILAEVSQSAGGDAADG
jgi:hypothetical protein